MCAAEVQEELLATRPALEQQLAAMAKDTRLSEAFGRAPPGAASLLRRSLHWQTTWHSLLADAASLATHRTARRSHVSSTSAACGPPPRSRPPLGQPPEQGGAHQHQPQPQHLRLQQQERPQTSCQLQTFPIQQQQWQQQRQQQHKQQQCGGSGIASDHVVVPLASLTAAQQPQCVVMPNGQLGIVLPVLPASLQSIQHPPWSNHVPPPRPPPLPPPFDRHHATAPSMLPQKRPLDASTTDHLLPLAKAQSANQLAAQELRKKFKRSGTQLPGGSTSSLASPSRAPRQDEPRHSSPTVDPAVQGEALHGQLPRHATPGSQTEAVQVSGAVEGAALPKAPAVAASSPSAQLPPPHRHDSLEASDTSDMSDIPECVATLQRGSDDSELVFLGTGAAEPSKYRGPSCIHLRCRFCPCSLAPSSKLLSPIMCRIKPDECCLVMQACKKGAKL